MILFSRTFPNKPIMHRTIHIAASFAIVLVAYVAYSLIAVPLIEPAGPGPGLVDGDDTPIEYQSTQRQAQLAEIFPPGAWEHDAPVLQSDQFKLLFQKYENQGDGVVKITPCTMVFTPGDPDDSAPGDSMPGGKPRAAPIVLQAPQGAILKFDEDINLKRVKLGKLIGGRFIGRVTVKGKGTKPGSEDDLEFITDDLQLSETEVYTTQPVQFRYGPHYGSGRDMRIKLANTKGDNKASKKKPWAQSRRHTIARTETPGKVPPGNACRQTGQWQKPGCCRQQKNHACRGCLPRAVSHGPCRQRHHL